MSSGRPHLSPDLLGKRREARLGSRKLTGTFGSATCTLREAALPTESTPASSDDQTVSLWFTSDVIARSDLLGPGGTTDDLIHAFKREGIDLGSLKAASIRHRRVDSWSPADNGPRASRLAVQAGSVLQMTVSNEVRTALVKLAPFGVGELTAQGYGRYVVDHPLLSRVLSRESLTVTKATKQDFISSAATKGGEGK